MQSNVMTGVSKELTLKDILAVEDDTDFLDFKCKETGIILWPLIRIPFFRLIISDLLYGTPLSGPSGQRQNWLKILATLWKATVHNYSNRSAYRRDIVVMPTGVGNILINGKWFNRLGDHFALAFVQDTIVVEEIFQEYWPFPRHVDSVLFHAPIRLQAILAERMVARFKRSKTAIDLVVLVKQRAKKVLGWELNDQRANWLIRILEKKIVGLPFLLRNYESFIRQINPRLLVLEEGCYGGHLAILIAIARRMGVITAEYQHGTVSAGHDAYNVAPTLQESSAYRATLPDYFLGYGNWWNQQINTPVAKLAIGNPHRSEQIQSFEKINQEKTDILILGDGIEIKLYLALAKAIAKAGVGIYRVVFRPHPLERTQAQQLFPSEEVSDGVYLDRNPDIYQSFATAHAVLSEVSTGLFEAIGIVERIFIWDTPKARFGYPSHPFQRFSTPDELVVMLRETACGIVLNQQIEEIWAPHWKNNYQNFVQRILRR